MLNSSLFDLHSTFNNRHCHKEDFTEIQMEISIANEQDRDLRENSPEQHEEETSKRTGLRRELLLFFSSRWYPVGV